MKKRGAPEFSLYVITPGDGAIDQVFYDKVKLSLDGGARAVQLREKTLGGRELLGVAERVRTLTRRYGAFLFINDRVDVAMLCEADGVHLSASSIPADTVRKLVGGEPIIGASAHTLAEAIKAEEHGADFVTFGPVYRTPSKAKFGPPLGAEALAETTRRLGIPVYAIGGVDKARTEETIKAGASGVAAIGAVFSSADVRASTAEMIAELNRCLAGRRKTDGAT